MCDSRRRRESHVVEAAALAAADGGTAAAGERLRRGAIQGYPVSRTGIGRALTLQCPKAPPRGILGASWVRPGGRLWESGAKVDKS